jgi:hypothetical protein
VHPGLRREDGLPFLVVYRAGTTTYGNKVDDPFFAAHILGPDGGFVPDYEATALGCLEQFQFCIPSHNFCTPWGQRSQEISEVIRELTIWQDTESLADIMLLFHSLPTMLSVYDYLSWRCFNTVPLTPRPRWTGSETYIHNREQWVTEIETWFMKGILEAFITIQNGALSNVKPYKPGIDMDFEREFSLCARILFREGAYTNINWIGLWATTATLIVICTMSYMVMRIHNVAVSLLNRSAPVLAIFLAVIAEMAKRFRANGSTSPLQDRLAGLWRSFYLPQFPQTARAWFGNQRPSVRTQVSELGDVEPVSASHRDRHQSDI